VAQPVGVINWKPSEAWKPGNGIVTVRLAALAGHGTQNIRELYLLSLRIIKYFSNPVFFVDYSTLTQPHLFSFCPPHDKNALAFFL
jgi:hypothetical protein